MITPATSTTAAKPLHGQSFIYECCYGVDTVPVSEGQELIVPHPVGQLLEAVNLPLLHLVQHLNTRCAFGVP